MHRFALFLVAAAALSAQPLEPLFDGESVDGWVKRSGVAEYRVEDGALVGRTKAGSPNTFLGPAKEYGDFILEFEVKMDPRLNSGVQIRSHEYDGETQVILNNNGPHKRTFPKGRMHGYQVEIASASDGSAGGIYDEARRGWLQDVLDIPGCTKAFVDDEWNRYRVDAYGDRMRVWVNGEACADVVDPLDQTGYFGFQVHSFKGDTPAEVAWRNIQIADLGRHVWKPVSLDDWNRRGSGSATVSGSTVTLEAKQGSGTSFLVSPRRYADFTLRLEYRASSGNSGVFFRAVDLGKKQANSEKTKGIRGYEIEVDPTRDPGGLQEVGGRGWIQHTGPIAETPYYKADDWNQLVIHAHGGRVVVHVNGVKTAEVQNDPGPKGGYLALQLNSRQADVKMEYRNLEFLLPE